MVQGGQRAAGVQQVGLLGDLAEQGAPLLTVRCEPKPRDVLDTLYSVYSCCLLNISCILGPLNVRRENNTII